jgi:CheY-like chemotaxis protein
MDESVAVQKAVEATLEPKGFEVISLSGLQGAMEEVKRIKPDIVLVDGELDDGKGYELCRRFKENHELAGIPVILLGSESKESVRQKAEELGIEGYMVKPIEESELVSGVTAFVDVETSPAEQEVDFEEELVEAESIGDEEDILELTEEIEEEPTPLALEGEDELTLEEGKGDLLSDTGGFSLEEELGDLSEEVTLGDSLELDLPEVDEELKIKPLAEDVSEDLDTEPTMEEVKALEEEREGGLEPTSGTSEFAAEELDILTSTDELETLSLEEEVEQATTYETRSAMADTEELEEITLDEELDEELMSEIASGEGQKADKGTAPWMEDTQEDLRSEAEPLEEGEVLETLTLEKLEEEVKKEEALDAALGDTDIIDDLGKVTRAMEEMEEKAEPTVAQEAVVEEKVEPPAFEETVIEEKAEPPSTEEVVAEERVEPPAAEEAVPIETMIEETSLEEEVAPLVDEEVEGGVLEVEFQEISLDEIPILQRGEALEMTEEDLEVWDYFPQMWLKEEINAAVEKMVMEMAPPIVERVSREIALEKAEQIIKEEIELTRPKPQSQSTE